MSVEMVDDCLDVHRFKCTDAVEGQTKGQAHGFCL